MRFSRNYFSISVGAVGIVISSQLSCDAQTLPPPPPPIVKINPVIFFDHYQTFLSQEGINLVAAAAANIIKLGATKVTVTGHCDLSESLVNADGDRVGPEFANAFTLKRAQTVRQKLYEDGVPTSVIIEALGVGFSQPDNPQQISPKELKDPSTDLDAFRDPLNRNAKISF